MGMFGLFLFGEKDEILLRKVATIHGYDYAKLRKIYTEVMNENVDYDHKDFKFISEYDVTMVEEIAKLHKVDVAMVEDKYKEVLIRMDA